MEAKERRRKALKSFFKAFFLTLLVLAPAYAGVFMWQSGRLETRAEQAAGPAERVEVAVKSYNLLLLLTEDDELFSASLVRFDAKNTLIAVCALPGEAVLLDSRTPRTMREIEAVKGPMGVSAALSDTLGVPVSGFAAFELSELSGVVDALGAIPFTLDRDVVTKSDDGFVTYSKQAGTTKLSGLDVLKLLTAGGCEDGELIRLRERLWTAAVNAYSGEGFSAMLAEVYSDFVNLAETDINTAGAYALSKAAAASCGKKGAELVLVRAEGAFTDFGYELKEGSSSKLTSWFGTTAPEN